MTSTRRPLPAVMKRDVNSAIPSRGNSLKVCCSSDMRGLLITNLVPRRWQFLKALRTKPHQVAIEVADSICKAAEDDLRGLQWLDDRYDLTSSLATAGAIAVNRRQHERQLAHVELRHGSPLPTRTRAQAVPARHSANPAPAGQGG